MELLPLDRVVEKPLITFVVLGDTHTDFDSPESVRILSRALGDVNMFLDPAFVITVGDLATERKESLTTYKRFMD